MLSLEIKNEKDIANALVKIATLNGKLNGKIYDLELREHREKRSKNANDYSWVLQDKIAKALSMNIDELHSNMVLSYGVIETYTIRQDAFESAKRMFNYYKILGESKINGK